MQKIGDIKNMKTAFTLVEVLIVVAILGILAAVVIPEFQNSTQLAKESTAKENLQILRTAIERYTNRNNGIPPGYANGDPLQSAGELHFFIQMVYNKQYLSELPKNPFNKLSRMRVFSGNDSLPDEAFRTDFYGWAYEPSTKTIRLNWLGTDENGVRYYDY